MFDDAIVDNHRVAAFFAHDLEGDIGDFVVDVDAHSAFFICIELAPGLDWAKADFEVTYRSNGDDLPGLARRRFSYDDAFGPWSGMSSDDASSYYQIWTQNKTLIQTYEGKYGSQRSIANNEFGLTGDQRIPLSLNDDLSTIRGVTFVNGRTVWNKSSTSFMDNSNTFPDFYIDNFECYNELPMVK